MSDTTPPPEEPVIVTPVAGEHTSHKPSHRSPAHRSFAARVFAVDAWGVIVLVCLSIIAGLVLLELDFNPDTPGMNIGGALWQLFQTLLGAFLWMIKNFWRPLLAGAAIVLPLWVLWRLVSLPFRK